MFGANIEYRERMLHTNIAYKILQRVHQILQQEHQGKLLISIFQ